MELRTLQYFLTVAREENITRASEVLHITQPTLSRQMKQLEQELGTELFVRGRNFALTEAGMLLRRRAEEVVDMMYKIESEIETPVKWAALSASAAVRLNLRSFCRR